MGFSHKSHDRKSDKETQSPMLKIFKEIMQKEHKDTEKANLLKEKQEKQLKKNVRPRSKSDQKTDTSSMERSKNKYKKKMAEHIEQNQGNWMYDDNGTQSMFQPYQNEKRDSWWLWKDADKKRTDDTCSCATCPLKKLMGSDFACVGCLIILFLISVLITSLVVFKTMPLTLGHRNDDDNVPIEFKSETVTETTVETTTSFSDIWSTDLALNRLGSYAGLFGSGYGDSSFRDSNMLDDEGKVSRELASVIGTDKLYDLQGSEKLREFYKKLIQTDTQIKKLKQNFESNDIGSHAIGYNINAPERYKRSLKFIKPKHRNRIYNFKNKNSKKINSGSEVISNNKNERLKREYLFGQPEGYLIEKKKVLIQYKPFESKRQFPKCSHTLKDLKSHEKHLKHPFYQNSQRLDELLDHILDKNMPEIVTDPLTLDLLFSNKAKCNHKFENNSYNEDLYKNDLKIIETESSNREAKPREYLSIFKTTTQNVNENSKDETNFPTINVYKKNITIFDQAAESHNLENLMNQVKTEPNIAKNNYFTDPSLQFMAKIHGNDNLATSPKTDFGRMVEKNKFTDKVHQESNYANFKSFYDQNANNKLSSNEIDHNKNMKVDSDVNFNMKGFPHDHLIEMMIDDPRTDKTFDVNLDYSDILLSSTPKLKAYHTINSINQEKEPDINLENYITDLRSKNHNLRKILQIEEEDDNTLGYEDLKEVLVDEVEAHDETDRRVDRKKRDKSFPDVYNRDWKGPIPLYPDEVKAMIKQAAIENIKIPVPSKDVIYMDRTNNQISDTDYIEDYFHNKYDRLVRVAQAYSDYGVLGGKKDLNENKDNGITEKDVNRNKLDIEKNFDCNMNVRSRKEAVTNSEGIRFEIKSRKGEGVAKESEIMGAIQKHIKFMKGSKTPEPKTLGFPYIHPEFSSIPNLSTQPYSFEKIHKLYTESIDESISAPRRKLKSIEYGDDVSINNGTVGTLSKDLNDSSNKGVNGEINKYQTRESLKDELKNNRNLNGTTKVSDFFTMMSDWFRMLAKLSGETNTNGTSNLSTVSKDNNKYNISTEISYPLYDSDMIENIGHRSRVLMSIRDNNASVEEDNVKDTDNKSFNINRRPESTGQTQTDIDTTSATINQVNVNVTAVNNKKDQTEYRKKDDTSMENKTISKRSIQTNNQFNFWNDIYDDEYGVKLDYFEKYNRDKHSVSNDNLVKKSKNWFEGKVKSIASKLRSTKATNKEAVSEKVTPESTATKMTSTSRPNVRKRRIRNLFSDDAEDSNDFAALTANMKKVVREAANAVRETRKLKIREDNKEETIASSLMQQLVRLMSDVVDFQVQQKTCAKLPPDLQKFLEWLTSSSDKEPPHTGLALDPTHAAANGYNEYAVISDSKTLENNVGFALPEDNLDDRTKCLGNVQAIQDLMKQYDDMNDEDKSKMTGIKEYLENQLNFLNKKVSAFDEYNTYKYNKKRDTQHNGSKKITSAILKREKIKSKFNKFLRNYGKKHTRTTAGNINAMTEAKVKSR